MNNSEIDKLAGDSKVYNLKSEIYERFSAAEDSAGKISKILKQLIKNKVVLDLGCGTGRFIEELSPIAKEYFALDRSERQLAIAKSKVSNGVSFLCSSGDRIKLPDESVDIVFATWVLGSIRDLKLRERILREVKRILRDDGEFYLIENDSRSDYKDIVDKEFGKRKTEEKNEWLVDNGFELASKIKTYIEFDSIKEAKLVFESIWNHRISGRIKNKKISHDVILWKLKKY